MRSASTGTSGFRMSALVLAAGATVGLGVSAASAANIRPWEATTINWVGTNGSNWNDAGNWTSVANRKLQQVDNNGDLVYSNPPTNTTPVFGPDTTTATIPGNDQAIGNTPIIQNATTNTRPYDTAQFGNSSQLTVNVDSGRFVANLNFTGSSTASYTFNGSPLTVMGGTIGGDQASTITFNNDVKVRGDYNVNPGEGQTFNFNGTTYQNAGRSFQIGSNKNGTINFNVIGSLGGEVTGGTNGDPKTGNPVNIRFLGGGATTVNLGADNKAVDGRVNISFDANNTKGVVNLNHANAVYSDTGRGATGVTISNGGTVNVNVADAIGGTNAYVNVGTHSSDTATTLSLMTIKAGQAYEGATKIGKPYVSGQARTADQSLLLVNNSSGSGTGNSDITVDTGTLGGNGFIVNTGAKGITFNSHGVLSPGASAGAIGTLTIAAGTKGLDLSGAAGVAGSGAFKFDLSTLASHDLVNLTAGQLKIGTLGLEFDDFVFNFTGTPGTLPTGTYTLFQTTQSISGTLGLAPNLAGLVDGKSATVGFDGTGQNIVLTVIPEPASLSVVALGALGLLARRRRMA